ncbi:hypothetical protein TNCV_4536331 [Trichonephila clavipes]|nr:hypothetical protein TNCV_4536331 [Trichonephila clavipes]
MSNSGFEPEPTGLHAKGHSPHTGWETGGRVKIDIRRRIHRRIARGKCVTLFRWGVGNASPFFGGVRGTPRNSSACKQQQGLYTNYCCNPYGKAAPHQYLHNLVT